MIAEYSWTVAVAKQEDVRAVMSWEKRAERPFKSICLNVLAMFGLFHLNKDHTFRPNDANMNWICTSWLNTLCTVTTKTMQNEILSQKEALCRTASHPFGLAQTYWLARVLARANMLASPLSLRTDVTPPPVERIMKCDATRRRWEVLPAGKTVSSIYQNEITLISQGVNQVKRCLPAYSGLYRLYGLDAQIVLDRKIMQAADALMPAVVGYESGVSGNSIDDTRKKRNHDAITNLWASMWDKYISSIDKGGIATYAKEARAAWALRSVAPAAIPRIG